MNWGVLAALAATDTAIILALSNVEPFKNANFAAWLCTGAFVGLAIGFMFAVAGLRIHD